MPTVTKIYYHNIDLDNNQLLNAVIENRTTAPTNPVDGQLYYNNVDKKVYVYNVLQSTWNTIASQYVETDPIFTASAAFGITSTNITNWNTAYSWGNHASVGYVLNTRTLTINGTTQDLSADRTFTVSAANIYNADGTLTGNRTITNGGFTLAIRTAGIDEFTFTPNNGTNPPTLSIFNSSFGGRLSLGYAYMASGGGALFIGTTGGQNVNFITNNVTRATLTGAGRLLLGTTTESTFILDAVGTARVSNVLSVVSRGFDPKLNLINDTSGRSISEYGADGTTLTKHWIKDFGNGLAFLSTGGGSATNMTFVVNTNSQTTDYDGITINDRATTISGSSALNFFTQGRGFDSRYNARISSSNNCANPYDTAFPDLRFWTSNSSLVLVEAMRIDNNQSILVGSTTSVASSIFTLASTTKGFLPPRMTTTQRDAISSPATGLQVYDTTLGSLNVYNGTSWIALGAGGGGGGGMAIGGSITSATAGSVLFAGTSGVLQQDNANFFWDDTNNRLGIGTNSPTLALDTRSDVVVNGWVIGKGSNTALYNLRITDQSISSFGNITTANNNIFIGRNTGISLTTGVGNVSLGQSSGQVITSGSNNFALGNLSAVRLQTGDNNISIGGESLLYIVGQSNNIALGIRAGSYINGYTNATPSSSIYIGNSCFSGAVTASNEIVIGNGTNTIGLGSNTTTIGNTSTITANIKGRLLLGTTTDTGLYQLDVNGTARISGALVLDGFTNPTTCYLSLRDGYDPTGSGGSGITAKNNQGSSADGLGIWGNDGISFNTSQIERMLISQSGVISFPNSTTLAATTFSTTALVNGILTVDGFANPTGSFISLRAGYTSIASGFAGLSAKNHDAGNADGLALWGQDGISFQTALTERARITAAGRLLLGITSESTFLLDVNGTARITGNAELNGIVQINNSVVGDSFVVNGASSSSLTFNTDSSGRAFVGVSSNPSATSIAGAYFTATGYEEAWFNVVSRQASSGNKYWRFGNLGSANYFAIQKLNDAANAINATPLLIFSSTGNVLLQGIGTSTTDTGFRLDVTGSARVSGVLTIGATGASFNIAYVTGGNGTINLGGTIGASPDRSIAVGGVASGLLSTAVGISATASGGGTAIGGYQTVATGGVAISSGIGAAIASGTQATAVGNGAAVYTANSAAAINGVVGASGNNSNGVAILGTVVGNIGNGSIAIIGYAGANQSVAIYGSTSAANEFVVGSAYDNGDMTNFAMTNVYFGSGKQRANNGGVNKTGAGIAYTINGSGAFGTDFAGGNITIAGGKGTGTGTAGDVIFSTATTTTSGTTLQSLTERVKVFGNTGNVLIQNGGTFVDGGFRLDVNGTARVTGNIENTNGIFTFNSNGGVSKIKSYGNDIFIATTNGNGLFTFGYSTTEYTQNAKIGINNANNTYNAITISTPSGQLGNGAKIAWLNAGGGAGTIYHSDFALYDMGMRNQGGNYIHMFATGNVLLTNGTLTDAGYKLDVNGTTRVSGALTVTGSTTATSAIARGANYTPTLVASANGDTTVAMDIIPTFTNGAFTGVTNIGLRVSASGLNPWAIYSTGGNSKNYFGGSVYVGTESGIGSAKMRVAGTLAATVFSDDEGYGTSLSRNYLSLYSGSVTLWGAFSGGGLAIFSGTPDTEVGTGVLLSLNSTTKGFRPPRVTTTQKNAISAVTGLMVYDSTLNLLSFYNGTAWSSLASGNIYTTDGTLTANRTVTMGSFTLSFEKDVLVNGLTIGKGSGSISSNTAIGSVALNANTTGYENTAIGKGAAGSITTGNNNVAVGYEALILNVAGDANTAIGSFALRNNTNSTANTAIGRAAMFNKLTGDENVAIGRNSMYSSQASQSVAIGNYALGGGSGANNTAVGFEAMFTSSGGSGNTAIGMNSMYAITTGGENTAIGFHSIHQNTTGTGNIALGYFAGRFTNVGQNTITNNSIYIGYTTKALANNQTNQIVIGYETTGLGSNTTVIGNSSTTDAAIYGRLLVNYTSPSPGTNALDVNGTARVSGKITGRAALSNSNLFDDYAIELNGINTTDGTTRILINCGTLNSQGIGYGARALNATIDGYGVGTFITSNGNSAIGHVVNAQSNSLAIPAFAARSNGQSAGGSIGYIWMNGNTQSFFHSIMHNEELRFYNPTGSIYSIRDRLTTNITFGSNTHYASAQLAIDSTTKGFLPPRMTTTQRDAITSPATGLVVYNTTLNSTDTYDGARWRTDSETIVTNRQTASYSLLLADRGKLIEMNVASANTLTIPLNSSIAFPIGTKIDVTQYGAGATTITATGGVTIRSFTSFVKLAGQYAAATLVKIGTDEWYAYGNLIA